LYVEKGNPAMIYATNWHMVNERSTYQLLMEKKKA